MEAEDEDGPSDDTEEPEEEEDEDDDPVGDPDEDEAEEDDVVDDSEPSEEQIDKIADLVVQKLKDKAEDEADEEEEPETTEAEAGEEEEIDTKPKVENLNKNPHHRGMWEEALRKVYEEKVPTPIPEIIKSVGKQLRDYALKSGGIDKNDFLRVSDVMQKGKIPKASIIPDDTDPREFVMDLMAKTMGWKFVEQEYNMRFNRRHDYVESFQGGEVLQEHCGECGAINHLEEEVSEKDFDALKKGDTITIEFKGAMSSGKSTFTVTAKNTVGKAKVEKVTLKDSKRPTGVKHFLYKRGNKVSFAQGDMAASVSKYTIEEVEIEESDKAMMMKLTTKAMKAIPNSPDQKELIKQVNVYREKLGMKPMKEEKECPDCKGGGCENCDDSGYLDEARKETPAEFLKRGGKIKKVKAGMGKEGKKKVADFKKSFKKTKAKEDELDAKDKEEREKNNEETVHETWLDNDAKKVQSKWKKMDDKAKKKWMDGVMAKAKKDKMPKDEVMDVLDDYGLVEGTMTGKDSDSIEGQAKGVKHKCPTHVKKEGFGYGKNISHTLSENIVDKMNIYWFDSQEVSVLMPTSEVEIVSEGYHSMKNHREKFKSTNKIAEGYMVLPAIDRNKYTPMRGMEGPFPTFSGKVLYYDPKAGQYYDRDSDRYLEYDEYLEHDKMSSSQRKQMDMGPLGDPKSKEYKAMERIKNKAEKMAKKNRLKAKNESIGMNFIRKHYQKNDE